MHKLVHIILLNLYSTKHKLTQFELQRVHEYVVLPSLIIMAWKQPISLSLSLSVLVGC